MSKHIDSVPKLADFKAPWESEQGEVEIDKPKLRTWIHNLLTDKAKAQDARDAEAEKVKTVEAERDQLKSEVDVKDPDASKKIAKAEKERDDAKAEAAKANLRADRIEIAVEKGLTPAQASRLIGETKEELEADADKLIEDLGIKPGSKTDEDDEDEEGTVRVSPRSPVRLVTGGDPDNSGDKELDYEKIAAEIGSRRVL